MGRLSKYVGRAMGAGGAAMLSKYLGFQETPSTREFGRMAIPAMIATYTGSPEAGGIASALLGGSTPAASGPGVSYGGGGGFAGGTAGDYLGAGGTGYQPPSFAPRYYAEPEYEEEYEEEYDDEFDEDMD